MKTGSNYSKISQVAEATSHKKQQQKIHKSCVTKYVWLYDMVWLENCHSLLSFHIATIEAFLQRGKTKGQVL